MVFKLKVIILGLIFISCFPLFILQAAELSIPLPENSVKLSERFSSTDINQLHIAHYESLLSQKKIIAFYKKSLQDDGWKEQKSGYYSKNNYILRIVLSSPIMNKKGKNQFKIIVSRMPTDQEVIAMRKSKPDKLNFMPVYPDSIQLYFENTDNGAFGLYETEKNIKEVLFFYKSSMLNYGWTLRNESGETSRIVLVFNRGMGETCRIILSDPFAIIGNLPNKNRPSKTKISTTYYVPKKNK